MKEASCVEGGVKTFICAERGQTKAEEVKALGHSFTNYVSNGDATCNDDVTKTATCDNGCGAKDTIVGRDTVKEHASDYPIRENETITTCAAEDSYDEVVCCADCGIELSREPKTVVVLGHATWEWIIDPGVRL